MLDFIIRTLPFLLVGFLPFRSNAQSNIQYWLSTPDKSALFQKQQTPFIFSHKQANIHPTIFVDDKQQFQSMDGFGYTLTGGSATLINRMSTLAQQQLLQELFGTEGNAIGVNYLRISIGASDLSDHVFSYNDLPQGQSTDFALHHFSISPEKQDLIPVLKKILEINPQIKILASPWSPPTWMKTNNNSKGGSLKPDCYDVYAHYLIKYIEAMKAEGIAIDALTIQNEPLHPGNNPSLLMLPEEQALFIKKSLGPAFKKANIKTKILIYDHNADRPDYPINILNDSEARQYIDGSAFHLYGGAVEAIGQVRDTHPDKNVYFTEQWIGSPGNFPVDLAWHIKHLIIGASRQWCKTVLEWNLAADPKLNPHTEGGCTECLGAVTLDGDKIVRNPAYYIVAHASKFVRTGSIRIASNTAGALYNVAYTTPKGQKVLIVLNDSNQSQSFNIVYHQQQCTLTLAGGAVATYVWE
jgi:glucosylceramidase